MKNLSQFNSDSTVVPFVYAFKNPEVPEWDSLEEMDNLSKNIQNPEAQEAEEGFNLEEYENDREKTISQTKNTVDKDAKETVSGYDTMFDDPTIKLPPESAEDEKALDEYLARLDEQENNTSSKGGLDSNGKYVPESAFKDPNTLAATQKTATQNTQEKNQEKKESQETAQKNLMEMGLGSNAQNPDTEMGGNDITWNSGDTNEEETTTTEDLLDNKEMGGTDLVQNLNFERSSEEYTA